MADELRDLLQPRFAERGLVTRCLVFVEVLQGDEFEFIPDWDGLLPWDCLGWIEHARQYMASYEASKEDNSEE